MTHDFIHCVQALAPDADVFSGTVNTDVISMSKYSKVRFVVQIGTVSTGQTLIKLQACDDFTPSNTSVIAARYRVASSGDSFGAWTTLTTSGYTTLAASNQMIEIEVTAQELPEGYPNVRLNCVEATNDPIDGGVLAICTQARYPADPGLTAIA